MRSMHTCTLEGGCWNSDVVDRQRGAFPLVCLKEDLDYLTCKALAGVLGSDITENSISVKEEH